jgi:hypothetical protein
VPGAHPALAPLPASQRLRRWRFDQGRLCGRGPILAGDGIVERQMVFLVRQPMTWGDDDFPRRWGADRPMHKTPSSRRHEGEVSGGRSAGPIEHVRPGGPTVTCLSLGTPARFLVRFLAHNWCASKYCHWCSQLRLVAELRTPMSRFNGWLFPPQPRDGGGESRP